MQEHASGLPAFAPAALSASKVGTWETDFERDVTVCDATVAAMFGVDPEQAAAGLPLARFARTIHRDDRNLFAETVERVTRTGGLFIAEYRTVPGPDQVCWVMARGRYERDPETGKLFGRGIAIDITESKLAGHADDQLVYFPPLDGDSPLERAVNHTLDARAEIDQIGGDIGRSLLSKINDLLLLLGRTLSSAMKFRN